jgi:rod shape-determining protein MreD
MKWKTLAPPVERPPELLRPARMSYIALTVLFAILMNLLALPDLIMRVKPDFIALIVIYWTIFHPYRIGFALAWLLGLLMDVSNASVFGEHALAYTLMVYLAGVFHRRIIMFPLGYQVIHVLVILTLIQLLTLAIRLLAGSQFPGPTYFLPSLIGAGLWPLVTTLARAPLRQSPEQDAA